MLTSRDEEPPELGKSALQQIWDAVGIPLRMVLLPDAWSAAIGLTSLEEERLAAVLPQLRGRVLDVGAGRNTLVRRWRAAAKDDAEGARARESVGIDVHDWGGGVQVVEDSSRLPFPDGSFDTVALVACLNHIPDRRGVLREAARVLRPSGRLVLTMINPVLGGIGHRIWWYSEDKQREEQPGEVGGLWGREVIALCEAAGFRLLRHDRFVYRLNELFVAEKVAQCLESQVR